MSDEDDKKKKKPIALSKLMKEAAVPMPASPMAPKGGANVFSNVRGQAVPHSRDLERILALPTREPLDLRSARAEAMVQLITERYSNGRAAGDGCQCHRIDPRRFKNGANGCVTSVLPIQAWTLYETGLAGGALGSIVVGGGKCGRDTVEIYDYATGRRRSIAETGPVQVATFDRTLHVGGAAAFPSGEKPCVRFTLADGSSAEFSTDHPVLTQRGWVQAVELVPGKDFATVAAQMPDLGVTEATDDEVAFVAFMLADGGCSQRMLHFTNATPEIIESWSGCARALGYEITERHSRSKAREFTLRQEPGVRDKWSLFGLAKDKRAHAAVWGLPRRQVALFLNRFWACDGHVSDRGLECTLASEKLVDDLRFLCSRLGVRTRKHHKKASYVKDGVKHEFDAWRISVRGEAALKFLTEVGNILGKEHACAFLRERLKSTRRNTNYDVVPVSYEHVQEICDELGLPPRGQTKAGSRPRTDIHRFLGATPGQYVSRAKFVEFCQRWQYKGKYARLATTDVAWEKVVSVENIGVHPVFDLTVPGTHNFVANGVVVHNTILDILAVFPLGVETALALVPSNLLKQFWDDYQLLEYHFKVPSIHIEGLGRKKNQPGQPNLYVLPYGLLSRPGRSDYIDKLRPDAIICDEADKLADLRGSATAKRVLRYYVESEARGKRIKFCGWTGSLSDKEINEYAHLLVMALGDQAPIPLDPQQVTLWGSAIDVSNIPAPMGALRALCTPEDLRLGETKAVRRGYYRRLSHTLGVITTSENEVEVADEKGSIRGSRVEVIVAEKKAPPIPEIVSTALDFARGFVRPDKLFGAPEDEELDSPMEAARTIAEIASGVMNVWEFPPTTPDRKKFVTFACGQCKTFSAACPGCIQRSIARGGVAQEGKVIDDWYDIRKEWNKAVRAKVIEGAQHLDSPFLCEQAAARYFEDIPKKDGYPEWDEPIWNDWKIIRKQVKPRPKAVRVHPYIAEDAARWALENKGIVWYSLVEFGRWVAELSGLPMHGGGPKAGDKLKNETGERSIIASIESHGRGRNGLQFLFHQQLIAQIPSSARRWEQLLGRLIRRGQRSNEVLTLLYLHVAELRKAVEQALRRSEYVEETLGMQQKLLNGWRRHMTDYESDTEDDED